MANPGHFTHKEKKKKGKTDGEKKWTRVRADQPQMWFRWFRFFPVSSFRYPNLPPLWSIQGINIKKKKKKSEYETNEKRNDQDECRRRGKHRSRGKGASTRIRWCIHCEISVTSRQRLEEAFVDSSDRVSPPVCSICSRYTITPHPNTGNRRQCRKGRGQKLCNEPMHALHAQLKKGKKRFHWDIHPMRIVIAITWWYSSRRFVLAHMDPLAYQPALSLVTGNVPEFSSRLTCPHTDGTMKSRVLLQ